MKTPIFTKLALVLLACLPAYAQAQVSLVKWENFFFGPPIEATSYLPMNNGKILTGGGQSAPQGVPTLFVSSVGAPTDAVFCSNGWNNGAGNAYFIFNFATSNYSNNQVTFIFGIMGEFCPRNYKAQYSTSSSSGPWTDFGSAINLTGTVPLSGLSVNPTYTLPVSCDNQANVWVRIITTDNGLPSGHTGGPYIDNIDVSGTANAPASITGHPSNSTVCEGIGTSFSVTASNAVSYQWQLNSGSGFSNISNAAPYSGVNSATLNISQATTSMNGYQYRCVVSGGTPPDATSNSATLSVHAYGTWNGSVSSDWNNAANWDCGQVPGITTNVTIPATATAPVVNATGAICNNLNILSGGNLSFNGTGELEIKGDVTVAGGFDPGNGLVIFSGSGGQVIPGATYDRLTVNSSGEKTLGGAVTINTTLSLMLGTIALNSFNMTIGPAGSISGGNASAFIVTDGSGHLTQQGIGPGGRTGNITFPVGSTAASYTPLILNNSGTIDDFNGLVKNQLFESYTGTSGVGSPQSGDAVDKTWFIDEGTPGGSDVNLQLSWNIADELPGFDRSNCFLAHYTGASWDLPVTASAALGGGPFFVARDNITSFSPFAITGSGSPLPIDLLSFRATLLHGDAVLTWTVAEESNPERFVVERSLNGKDFEPVGTVKASTGTKGNYHFTDPDIANKAASAIFYRLNIQKTGEQSVFSGILKIALPVSTGAVRLYPNPVRDGRIHIELGTRSPKQLQLRIIDLSGKIIRESTVRRSGYQIEIPVKPLRPGNYILTLSAEAEAFSQTLPFIVLE